MFTYITFNGAYLVLLIVRIFWIQMIDFSLILLQFQRRIFWHLISQTWWVDGSILESHAPCCYFYHLIWSFVGVQGRFDHPYISFLFYGMDSAGDFIPIKQLREKYNRPRHEIPIDPPNDEWKRWIESLKTNVNYMPSTGLRIERLKIFCHESISCVTCTVIMALLSDHSLSHTLYSVYNFPFLHHSGEDTE